MKISKQRKVLVASFLLILVSLIAFTATTFAWFSDSVSSNNNIITVGNLDAEMYWADDLSDTWHNIEDEQYNTVFKHNNYEPGYTTVKYLKIVNSGALAFKYDLSLLALGTVGKLAEVVDLYYLSNVSSEVSLETMNKTGVVKDVLGKSLNNADALLPKGKNNGIDNTHEVVVAIALQMQKSAGNEYQGESLGAFTIQLTATQYNFESDSLGSDYDKNASFPVKVSTSVSTSNGLVTEEATMGTDLASAVIPAGVSVNEGTNTLTLSVTEMSQTQSNVVVSSDEKATSLDVHVSGISTDNTKPVLVTINTVSQKYLNKGNISLYHVENGVTVTMTQVNSLAELDAHNEFYYDSKTGTFTVALASFSEIRMVEKTINAWQGNADFSWYTENPDATEFKIYNADQLWAFSQIVGGMASYKVKENDTTLVRLERDTFEGKTIKLIADINLGDDEAHNNEEIVFYPIGFWNNALSYKRVPGKVVVNGESVAVSSTVYTFAGTFDGAGHTIANFYQNTWEMYGDYNSGYSGTPNYYQDAMGLFGYVNGGTVKNLTVKNFSSDGEFTPTGVVAAYARNAHFENISIKNCNPRVYNTGNGGIIGIAGSTDGDGTTAPTVKEDVMLTLSNITVDNSNKISALWGSWDVACGGLVGMYRGKGGIYFNDCHVSAVIDVNNDVCANYQYYAYRYAGMIIGSVRENETIDGKVYPKMAGIFAKDCTVHYSSWNNYFYCELVSNSIASYTHDYQMSRLTEITAEKAAQYDAGNYDKAGNFIYVVYETDEKGVVKVDTNGNEIVKSSVCYHIVNKDGVLTRHKHEDSGYETVNGEEVLVEDKQCLYLPFGQLITGYSWGVTNIGIGQVSGVSIMDETLKGSITKFTAINDFASYDAGKTITLKDLFASNVDGESTHRIRQNNIQVGISYYTNNNGVLIAQNVDVVLDRSAASWTDWTFVLPTNVYGEVTVTIQDYVYCNQTTVELHVHEYGDTYQKDSDGHWNLCLTCGEASEKVGHNWNSGTIQVAPTCTTAGSKNHTCKDCEQTKQSIVAALGHKEVVDAAKDPTCTETGLTEGSHCSVCKEVLVAQNTVAALGHKAVIDAAKAPTCTSTGLTEGSHCSVCKAVLVAQTTVAALGHDYVGKKDDLTHWQECTKCGNISGKEEHTFAYEKLNGSNEHEYHCVHDCGVKYYSSVNTTTCIFLKPNSNWTQSNAWFAARFYNDKGNEYWQKMTDSNEDGIYECEIPTNFVYTKVIFCRMNPNSNAMNWDNKWNQSADITLSTEGKNLFTITNGAWDNVNGTWSMIDVTTVQPKNYVTGNWSNWKAVNGLVCIEENAETGDLFACTIKLDAGTYDFKVVINGAWYTDKNAGSFKDTTNGNWWDCNTTQSGNTKITTTGGYYQFIFNTRTNKLQVVYIGKTLS